MYFDRGRSKGIKIIIVVNVFLTLVCLLKNMEKRYMASCLDNFDNWIRQIKRGVCQVKCVN